VRRWAVLAVLTLLVAAPVAEARGWSWLGVRIRDLAEQEMDELSRKHGIREGYGVVIVEVMEDTPAQRAGLRSGDVVVAVDGRPVTETRLLQRMIASGPVERDAQLTVLRPEGRRTLPVRLISMPRPIAGERVAAEFGFIQRLQVGAVEEDPAVLGVQQAEDDLEDGALADSGLAEDDQPRIRSDLKIDPGQNRPPGEAHMDVFESDHGGKIARKSLVTKKSATRIIIEE